MKNSLRIVVLLLSIPFLVNFIATLINMFTIPPEVWIKEPEKGVQLQFQRLYTYQVLVTSCVEIVLAVYLLSRSSIPFRELYREKVSWRFLGIVIGLVIFCEAIFMVEGFISAYLYYGGDMNRYWSEWIKITHSIPLWSRYFNAFAIPIISGICEEIIYRGYGITALEKYVSTKKAVIIQAIFFGLFHIWPIHIVITFLIGLVFGFVYTKRRKLVSLTIAHTLVDIIGFSTFLIL